MQRGEHGKNPANAILFRGAGSLLSVPSFEEKYSREYGHPLKGFVIAPTCIISGLGKSVGLGIPILHLLQTVLQISYRRY